jgi:hypothetical protein
MRLARQLSVTRCVEDQNWGQSRRMLWVTDGCRAEFVADGQGRGRWPGRGRDRDRDDDGERLVCESYEQKDKECRIRVRHEVRLVKQKSVTPASRIATGAGTAAACGSATAAVPSSVY